MSKKYPFDLASWLFGPNGLTKILSGLGKIKSFFSDLSKTKPLGLYPPGLPEGKQTPLLPSGNTSIVPINQELQTDTKTNFFTNTIKDAQTATQSIWQLFMNLLNKLRAAASNIFTGAFTSIKSKTIKFTNSIKAQYYKATNQAFMTDENGRVTKATVEDSRMTVYSEKTANSEASKFSRMWQNHVNRVRDSVNRVKEDFTTIWQHHNERVAQSVKYASTQFNKLKISASNIFSQISNTISNVFDGIKNRYSKAIDFMKAKTLSIRNAFAKMTNKGKPTYTDETGKVRRTEVLPATYESDSKNTQQAYSNVKSSASRVAAEVSRIWKQHIINLRTSFTALKNDISAIWQHHKARVADSTAYAESRFTGMTGRISAQFTKIKTGVSTAFTGVTNIAKTVSAEVKDKFGKISTSIVNIFNSMVNKIKTAFDKVKTVASDTAKIFKSKLGYDQTPAQMDISGIFKTAERQNEQLSLGGDIEAVGKEIAKLNNMDDAGIVKYIQDINKLGDSATDTQKALAAYATTTQAGGYSVQGATAFINQHNAAVKASGIAARLAAVGYTVLNAALSMGLSLLIQFGMEALMKLVDIIKDTINPLEKLTEQLSEMQTELANTESELNSVDSELERVRDRMQELLALPSLSFVEQEELEKLQKTEKSLENTKKALTAEKERDQKRKSETAQEVVDEQRKKTSFDGNFKSVVDNAINRAAQMTVAGATVAAPTGVAIPIGSLIGAITGLVGGVVESFAVDRISTEDKLNREIEGYDELIKRRDELQEKLTTANQEKGKFLWWETDSEYDKIKKELDDVKKEIGETESYIDTTFSEIGTSLDGVGYGQGADEALDFYNQTKNRWEITYGTDGATASAIEDVISKDKYAELSNQIDSYVKKLKDGDESAALSIKNLIENNTGFVNELKENGVEFQDALDYFTLERGTFDSSTIEGILAQYETAVKALSEDLNYKFTNDEGNTEIITWGDLFTKDDEGKWVAQTENISKVLNGCDETTREQFTKLAESVNSGEMEVEEAVRQLQLTGLSRAAELIENEFEGINKSMFKGLDDDISGLIDTFDELSMALENTASAMDTLDAAQTQMKNSNQISIKTALELISQTENWADVIDISNGKVVLAKGAEEALINERIQLIKTNLETARSQLVTQLATLNATKASTYATSADITNAKAQKTYQEATKQSTAVTTAFGAVIGTLANALVDADTGEWRGIIAGLSTLGKGALTSAFSEAYSSAIKTLDSQEPDLPSEAELEKQINDIDAMLGMVGNISTASDFAKNYDYSKTPGDKYEDKDSDKDKKTAKDRFDELAAKYDRKIATLQYKKDLIQSEIDKAEARGEVASEAFYQRQIELEEKNRQALVNKKKALEDYLKAQGKNMTKEEWADAQEEINSTALAIEECEKNVIDLGQAIDDVHWEYFDKFTSEVDDLGDENATLLSLVGDTDDAVDENGNWTASGVTQIGLNTQEMQRNLEMAKQMDKEKNRIQKSWNEYQRVLAKHGGDASKVTNKEKKAIQKKYGVLITSESEYQEKMQETSQKQRDYAKAAKDSKDAIEDLAKARVDKEVEAIEKEIDAYQELIDLKKQEIEAERDLHDFKKDVDKKTRDIGETQRKIASLSGSTDPADIALRRKLEAELRGQQEDLDETFYDHAKEAQLNALDEEAEAYEKSQNEKIKVLEKTLEDTETLITNAIMDMLINADTVLEQINTTAGLYGVSLSEELIAPWKDAAIKAGEYKEWIKTNIPNGVLAGVTDESGVITLFSNKMDEKINGPWGKAKTAVGNYVKYLGSKDVKNLPKLFTSWQTQIQNIANKWDKVKKAAEKAAQAQINAANVRVPKNQGKEEKTDPSPTQTQTPTSTSKTDPKPKMVKDGYIDTDSILTFSSNSNDRIEKINGVSYAYDSDLKHYYDMRDGVLVNGNSQHATYRFSKPTTIYKKKYAKGTLGTKKDEWAIDSEPQHGDELVVVPNKGVLSYMRKGTSVIPANLTKNLMEWGKLNPNDKNSSRNVNLISNNVSKSEVKLNLGIDRLTNGNLLGLGKDITDYIEDLTDSIKNTDELVEGTAKDTDKLIKETTKDTVDDSTNALKTISNMTDKYKSPISANLTTPWTNTTKKSKDFETGSKSNYDKVVQHINKYKGTLEMVLSKPYKNLTGDKKGNAVYEFLEYAKKTSINNIIDYAKKKSNSIKTSLSNGFNGAKSSISEFKQSGTTAINALKDKFTNKKTGLIKALNDTTEAAKNAKKAIENVPKYKGSSGGSNSSGGGTGSINKTVVPGGYISSGYGYRDPSIGGYAFHGGIDIAAGMGSEIHAPRDGVVSKVVRSNQGYGNYLVIDHGNGVQSLYGHTSSINVSVGDYVKKGDVIALVGSSGNSTGSHCHFEYRLNGVKQDPSKFPMFAKGTMGTKKDQWAVTDEPNFGDELKMYATPEGKLSFMRVGSTVVPADLTKELMDIANLGADNLTMPKLNSDINLMSNYISKPNLNLSFDSLVHVDNCSQDTLKDLEKMVDSKINTFSRQLNYSLKRFSK